jgi:AcrR family transcriptional regulator
MNKQPQITDQTRKNFVDAFISLNNRKPIEKITVKEITSITGNNRSTFYRYFPDVC